MTVFMKRAILLIAVLPGLFLLAAGWVIGGHFIWANNQKQAAEKRLGPEAPVLSIEGTTFRDLNKNGVLDVYEDPQADFDARIEDLLGQMTIEEKAGLLFQVATLTFKEAGGDNGWFINTFMGEARTNILGRDIRAMSVLSAPSPEDLASFTNEAQKLAERSRLGIPITFSSDPRHAFSDKAMAMSVASSGFSVWPEPLGLAAIGDEALAEEFGRIAAAEYRAVGLHFALHPMADLATEPRWSRVFGTFGEDADLSSRMTTAYIRGLQGTTIGPKSVVATAKHFPGGGPVPDGLDTHFSEGKFQAYPADMFDYHLRPFQAAIDEGVGAIMPTYGIVTGQTDQDVGANFNSQILNDLLRDELGFEGVVLTDYGITAGIMEFGPFAFFRARSWGLEGKPQGELIVRAIKAGADLIGGDYRVDKLIREIERGRISEARIDESARRILLQKFQLGLFENPYVDIESANRLAGAAAFMNAGLRAQADAHILLKNDNLNGQPILPLEQGLRLFMEGFDPNIAAQFGTIVETPVEADVILLKLSTPFEPDTGRSLTLVDNFFRGMMEQGDLDFKDETLERITTLMSQKPTVATITLTRGAVIPELAQGSAGLLANFGASDQVTLDIIFGRSEPLGKLPLELPRSMSAVVAQAEDAPYDSDDPLFPFGFGLRYEAERSDTTRSPIDPN